jgi:serine/threonine-protein kinase 24/25/MST4
MSQINSNFINYTKNGGDPTDRYELGGKIGEGGYGFVCEAYDKIRNENVAIKIIDLESAGDEVQDVHREIAVMSNLHCPQLIQYYASYVIGSKLWIVMEYLEAGSLLDIIKEFGPLQENDVAFIIRELLLALQYLHGERKIHRDVKASNLLVGRDGSIKLADLGVAGQLTESVDKRQTKIGTPFWMAPEVLKFLTSFVPFLFLPFRRSLWSPSTMVELIFGALELLQLS